MAREALGWVNNLNNTLNPILLNQILVHHTANNHEQDEQSQPPSGGLFT